jgi:pentatricopeptide repeat protein
LRKRFSADGGAGLNNAETVIREAVALKDWPLALQLYEAEGRGDASCTKAVLGAVGRLGQWRRALDLLEELRVANAADSKTYTDAALACSAAGQSAAVVALVSQGDADGVVLSQRFWGLATHAFVKVAADRSSGVKCSAWCGAVRGIHERLTSHDPEPTDNNGTRPVVDVRLLTSVLSCCANACSSNNRDDPEGPYRSAMNLMLDVCAPKGELIPDTALVNALLGTCDKVGDWRFAVRMLEHMAKRQIACSINNGSPTTPGEQGSPLEQRILETINVPPNGRSWNTVLSACGRAGQLEECAWLLTSMPRVDVYTANILMTALSKCGQVAPVLTIMSSLRGGSPSATLAAAALGSNDAAGLPGMQSIRSALESRRADFNRVNPAAATYNIAIGASGQHFRVAIALLREMILLSQTSISSTVKADAISFSNTIQACTKCRQWNLAVDLFYSMHTHHIQPNVITLNTALHACAEEGQLGAATQLLSKAELLLGILPDLNSFNSLLNAVANAPAPPSGKPHWQEANATLERMISRNILPDVVSISSAILSCRRGTPVAWQQALAFLVASGPRYGVAPNSYSLGATISCLGRAGQWQKALELLDRMEHDFGVAPDTTVCNAALSALERCGQWQASRDLLRAMQKGKQGFGTSCKPDLTSFASVVSVHARAGEWEGALEFSSQAGRSGRESSTDVQFFIDERWERGVEAIGYTAAIKACQDDWEKALAVLQEMQRAGVHPDRVAFNAAISACAAGGQWARALQLMEQMHAAWAAVASKSLWRLLPTEASNAALSLSGAFDVVTFNSAMDACVKGGASCEAVALFLHMCRGGGSAEADAWWGALNSAAIGAAMPAFPRVTGVRPDGLSFRILIEALDGDNDEVVSRSKKQPREDASHRAAYVFANEVQRGIFRPFSYGSYSALLASSDDSPAGSLGLWLPPRLGLVDLHGLSEASAKAALRYALSFIGAHAVVELGANLYQEETDDCDSPVALRASAARVEAALAAVVGPHGLTVVTGHGKCREGGEAAATLPTSIRAMCQEGLIAQSSTAGAGGRRRPLRGPGFVDPSPWHTPLPVRAIPGNDGAFAIPLPDVLAVAVGCVCEWRALRNHGAISSSDLRGDSAAVAMALLRSRALWEASSNPDTQRTQTDTRTREAKSLV